MEIPKKSPNLNPPLPQHIRHNRLKPPINILRLEMEINIKSINRST